MSDRIPLQNLDSPPPRAGRQTPAQSGGVIHTRSFTGRFRNLRLLVAGALFLLFFGTSWLNWNGHQAVLWDLGARQFHIFGATFWPQDFILLSAVLIISAFALFATTVFAGRVWCGFACPQSLWTWIFMWAEKVTEGDRSQRIKLDAAPWSKEKLLRRSAKHALWLAVSLITAIGFVGYFTPVRALVADLLTLQLDGATAFWLLFFVSMNYMNAGWLREKVCRDMCPYSRFQSVMFDADTLVVSYDSQRGEPRGQRRKEQDYQASGLGACVDCTLCVQVCPTGIDIRDGLQLECIGCGACVDACDSIMDRMGYARGLVRFGSERELAGGRTRWLRPRLIGYAAALLLMFVAFGWALQARPLVSLDVTRDRNTLFRENSAGQIENIYRLKVINKTQQPHSYRISLVDADGMQLQGNNELTLAPGEIIDVPLSVAQLEDGGASTRALYFAVQQQDDAQVQVVRESTFVMPVGR